MKEGEPVLSGPQANPGSTAPSNNFGPQPVIPVAPQYTRTQSIQSTQSVNQPQFQSFAPNTIMESHPISQTSGLQNSIQPMQQNITSDQPIILNSDKKKHHMAILIVIIIVVLSVIATTAAIILSQKASASFAENVQNLYSNLDWFSYTSQCPRLAMELDNIYYSSEEYKAFADDCRNQASNIKDLIGALNGQGDQDFKNIYNILASAVNESIVFGDNLDQEIALYTDWHEFILNTQPSTPLVYNDDIEDAVAPLINSNNIVLKEFGEQWLQKQLELRFWQANAETFPDNAESQELLSASELGLQEFIINDTPDIIGMTKIGTVQDNPSLSSALFKLKYYIEENL